MNVVTLIGRLTRDVEMRASGQTAVASFSLAVDKQLSREKKDEMEALGKPTADFINIVVFGRQAETCNQYLRKGSQVAINGRIQTGSYTAQDGTRRYTTDVVANQVQFLTPKSTPKKEDDFWNDDFSSVNDDKIPF